MANLTADQIYQQAVAAGFSGQDAITATAIALAESSGNPSALADSSIEYSVGLWQINMKAHGTSFGSQAALDDPATNAKAAHSLYTARGGKFQDWSTYTNGSYKQYLPQAQAAASGGGAPAPVTASSGGNSFASTAVGFFTGSWMQRIFAGLAGGALLFFFVVKSTGKLPIPV